MTGTTPADELRAAAELAIDAHLGLQPAPWTVRQHPHPHGRQQPWLWACTIPGCQAAGAAVNKLDAHGHAADHHTRSHPHHRATASAR